MFTDVLIIIVPEFLSELEKFSLTPVFLFRVSCYHLFFQNLSLVVLVSSQSSPTSPPHTHSLTDSLWPAHQTLHQLALLSVPGANACFSELQSTTPPTKDGPLQPRGGFCPHISVSPPHCLHLHCPGLVCSACPSPSRAALVLLPAIEEGRGDTQLLSWASTGLRVLARSCVLQILTKCLFAGH